MSEGSSEHSLHEEIGYRVSFGAKTFSTQKKALSFQKTLSCNFLAAISCLKLGKSETFISRFFEDQLASLNKLKYLIFKIENFNKFLRVNNNISSRYLKNIYIAFQKQYWNDFQHSQHKQTLGKTKIYIIHVLPYH